MVPLRTGQLALVVALIASFVVATPADARKRRKAKVTKAVKVDKKAAPAAVDAAPAAADNKGAAAAPAGAPGGAAGAVSGAAASPAAAPAKAMIQPPQPAALPKKPFIKSDPKRVFLFLDPIVAPAEGKGDGGALAGVLTSLARARLNATEAVRLKTWHEMPEVPEVMARFGDLDKRDRVSLITIKNVTGFDGLVRIAYAMDGDKVRLKMVLYDFRNGTISRVREIRRPVDAALFRVLEDDLITFATTVRRSYRVTLRISSQPKGSKVLINGRAAGTTPLVTELKGGKHTVRIEKTGFRSYERSFTLSDGDRLEIEATLYNPLAARFLNAPPGYRVDARHFDAGYRYVWLNVDRPDVNAGHFFELAWSLRLGPWDIGAGWATTSMQGENQIDTFLGPRKGLQRYDISLNRFTANVRYPLLEKYAFASVNALGRAGMTFANTDDAERSLDKWSVSGTAALELSSRLMRQRNFGLELRLQLGLDWLGTLPYTERTFSLYGTGKVEEQERSLWGPSAALALRMVFWNDIF